MDEDINLHIQIIPKIYLYKIKVNTWNWKFKTLSLLDFFALATKKNNLLSYNDRLVCQTILLLSSSLYFI